MYSHVRSKLHTTTTHWSVVLYIRRQSLCTITNYIISQSCSSNMYTLAQSLYNHLSKSLGRIMFTFGQTIYTIIYTLGQLFSQIHTVDHLVQSCTICPSLYTVMFTLGQLLYAVSYIIW